MDLSTLYWVLILPKFGDLFSFFGGLIFLIMGVLYGFSLFDDYPWHKKIKKIHVAVPFIVMSFAMFIPSEKQMMYIIGGYAATNVEDIEKLPKNVVDAANKFLESYTDTEKKDK